MLPKSLLKEIESGNVSKFYESPIWRKKRKQVLKENNFECQDCKDKGGFAKADVVHHIKHLRSRPDLALDDDNLRPLCHACHNKQHPEKFEKFKQNWVKKDKEQITPERW